MTCSKVQETIQDSINRSFASQLDCVFRPPPAHIQAHVSVFLCVQCMFYLCTGEHCAKSGLLRHTVINLQPAYRRYGDAFALAARQEKKANKGNKWENEGGNDFYVRERCFNICVELAVIKWNCSGGFSMCVCVCDNVCIHCSHFCKLQPRSSVREGKQWFTTSAFWEIDHSALMYSFFLSLNIFPQYCSLSLSLSLCLSLSLSSHLSLSHTHTHTHTSRSPWRWKVEGRGWALLYENADQIKRKKKERWCQPIFSSSWSIHSLFHPFFPNFFITPSAQLSVARLFRSSLLCCVCLFISLFR